MDLMQTRPQIGEPNIDPKNVTCTQKSLESWVSWGLGPREEIKETLGVGFDAFLGFRYMKFQAINVYKILVNRKYKTLQIEHFEKLWYLNIPGIPKCTQSLMKLRNFF